MNSVSYTDITRHACLLGTGLLTFLMYLIQVGKGGGLTTHKYIKLVRTFRMFYRLYLRMRFSVIKKLRATVYGI